MRRIGKVFLLGMVVGLVIAAVRVLRSGPRPAAVPSPVLPAPRPAPAADPVAADPGAGAGAVEAVAWVAAVDGACPEGFPVKVKVKSGIFHEPGRLSYARTRPDRCYPTAAAAEADGYRAALR